MSDTVEAVVTHELKGATAAQVFDAWTQEEQLRAWGNDEELLRSSGSDGVVEVQVDARPGGRFRFSDRRDGVVTVNWGTYLRVERPHLLEFTWFADDEDGESTSVVRIEITQHDRGCTVVLTHTMDAEWAEYLDRTEQAWTAMLAAIDRSLS